MPPEEIGYAIPAAERPGILSRLVRMNRYLMLLLLVPAGLIYFSPPYRELEDARRHLGELQQERDARRGIKSRKEEKLELIKNDPEYLEVMARDRLRLQKDGEMVFRFEQ